MKSQRKSHWGWGYQDRFGSSETRHALGQMAEAMLGLSPGKVTEPVPLSSLTLPAPRIRPPASLAPILDDDDTARIGHTFGKSFPELVRGFRGDFAPAPDLVARPTTEDCLLALMRWAQAEGVALVPYGGGTSVVQGVTPDGLPQGFQAWVSVDMSAFDAVGEVNRTDRTVTIGAGAFGPAIEEGLAAQGFTLRHFPQSFEFSTLGGWLATRAGGHFATNYTRIDDLVHSIRLISPTGIWQTPHVPATGAGPDPRSLILGSEGTLGFITSAVMKVRKRPLHRSRATIHFDDLRDAITACRRIAQAYLFPANCRLLDKREALFNGVVTEAVHVLLLGFESADTPVDMLLNQALDIALNAGGHCPAGPRHSTRNTDDAPHETVRDDARRWKQAFFEAPYLQSRLLSVGIIADTFETALPWSRFDAFYDDLRQTLYAVLNDVAGGGRLTLRFTHVYPDGPAPYFTFLFACPPDQMLPAWRAVKTAAGDVIARHNATITHHHAVGRLHLPWLQQERSTTFLRALRAVKAELDPGAILNPGVLTG